MTTAACRVCGNHVPAGNTFCGSCGARTDDSGQTVQTVTQPVVVPAAPVPETPAAAAVVNQTAPLTTPVTPAATDGAKPAAGPKQLRWLALLLLVPLIAGAVAFLKPAKASGEIVADTSLTAAGGKFQFAGGGEMDVPKDAVSTPEHVVVRKTFVRDRVVIPTLNGVPSTVFGAGTLPLYIFSPNITFLRPVVIILTVSPRAIAVRIFVVQNGAIRLLTVIPARGGIVRITITGFQNGLLVI